MNTGAVEVVAGHVTVLGYRSNIWGPPGGKFVRREIYSYRLVRVEMFEELRRTGRLSEWV